MTCMSLTRIADFRQRRFDIEPMVRDAWETGDYVVGEVTETTHANRIELTTGREIGVVVGDYLIGSLGVRAATLEGVGSWKDVQGDLSMQVMTGAGLLGRVTSWATTIIKPVELQYHGHVIRGGHKVRMQDFMHAPSKSRLQCPIVLLIGTSMSSGKTASARVIIRRLKKMGVRVAGAKLTGAGRYRDILAMSDAGADAIFDFVDVGLPSTICDKEVYRNRLNLLLGQIAESGPEVLVAEAGASPLEPYNGDVAVAELRDLVRFTVLCASDPYAVVGVTKGFGFEPNLVAGVASSTSAGVEVIRRLAEQPALNLMDTGSNQELDQMLKHCLGI
jgi:hypothetical protein